MIGPGAGSGGRFGKIVWGLSGTLTALLLWRAAAAAVGSDLVLPAPGSVIASALTLAGTPRFMSALAGTMGRVFEAFLLSLAAGGLSGYLASRSPRTEAFLAPLLTTMRATPVLALILLAMFWFPASQVPVFSAFLMAYPVFHAAAAAGMRAADQNLVQMSRLFRVPRRTMFSRLLLPSAAPQLLTGASASLGLAWKVVVAGEVLSQPAGAIGTAMQDARLSLETTEVFAWAGVAVLLCGLSEIALGYLARHSRPGAEP